GSSHRHAAVREAVRDDARRQGVVARRGARRSGPLSDTSGQTSLQKWPWPLPGSPALPRPFDSLWWLPPLPGSPRLPPPLSAWSTQFVEPCDVAFAVPTTPIPHASTIAAKSAAKRLNLRFIEPPSPPLRADRASCPAARRVDFPPRGIANLRPLSNSRNERAVQIRDF